MKTVAAALLMLVALFCVYGFIASGEPGPHNASFRIGYLIVGAVSLVSALAFAIGPRKS